MDPYMDRPTYFQTGNWNRIDWRGNEHIYRVLAEEGDQIYVIQIGYREDGKFKPHPPPQTKSRREVWRRRTTDVSFKNGTLYHIDERGIPAPMEVRTPPEPGLDLKYDKRKAAVDYMVNKWGDSLLTEKEIYRRAIKNTASYFDTDEQSVRRWFETYLYYGRHANALIAQDWNKGGPGVGRRGLKDEHGNYVMQGRRPAKQVDNPDGPELRMLVSPELYREFSTFLKIQAWGTDDRFPIAFQRFTASRFAFNRDKETGEIRAYQVKLSRLPKKEHLMRLGREIFHHERTERDIARRQSCHRRPRFTSGSTRDIVHDQLPVLDIDATSVDNRVIFPELPEEIVGHGRPTVLLAVDRGSGAIVGHHVTFAPENADGYLSCILSAYTPKERELALWGVPYLKGFVYGCTSKIFVDRGPGVSKKALHAIVGRLKVSMLIAAPYRPQAKGQVESEMGHTQRALSDLPGSTFPSGDKEKDKQNKKAAKTEAVSLRTFMQRLLVAISRRNLEVSTKHILTTDMLKRKVIPCPADVYWYNKGRLRGDAAQTWLWPVEKVLRMLCHKRVVEAPAGIVTLDGREFTSPALDTAAYRHKSRHDSTLEVTVYELPTSISYLMWEQPNGNLGVLEATEQTKRAYGDGTEMTVAVANRARNSLAYDAHEQARANDEAIMRNKPGQLSKAKTKKVADVDKHAEHQLQLGPKEQLQMGRKALDQQNLEVVLANANIEMPPPRKEVPLKQLYDFKKKHRLMVEM